MRLERDQRRRGAGFKRRGVEVLDDVQVAEMYSVVAADGQGDGPDVFLRKP